MNYNKVVLVGRLATDPELKYTPSGIPVSTFRIAVNRRMSGTQGEREADFINIVAWRQQAEFAASYLSKGRLILVDGRLQIRQWQAQDGGKRSSAEVVASSYQGIVALERLRDAAPSSEGAPDEGVPAAAPSGESAAPEDLVSDLDDPFADD